MSDLNDKPDQFGMRPSQYCLKCRMPTPMIGFTKAGERRAEGDPVLCMACQTIHIWTARESVRKIEPDDLERLHYTYASLQRSLLDRAEEQAGRGKVRWSVRYDGREK